MRGLQLIGLSVLFLLTGCTTSQVDYDPDLDYRQYLRYAFTERRDDITITLDDARIEQALKSALATKGLVLDPDHPQMMVFYGIQTQTEFNASGPSFGFGFGSGGLGVGVSTPQQYEEDIRDYVSIRFVDAKTKQVIWQAVDKNALPSSNDPEQRINAITQSVLKLVEQYPPTY
ncbi:hypothetical protein VST7929_03178 [Vibrio stylophorae]|uniref:DUF4136 domain-containing protein n=1 Tax=Vibrio stylophorae TaxID=659351 RepID=A0ABM8ZXW3_9VIBR|nr:DUF4136 domain-containing protein [Vibrio stylophorae]CAH0535686.1 hypothetical protein VST7929_03178 [Vibrio stylophorae]